MPKQQIDYPAASFLVLTKLNPVHHKKWIEAIQSARDTGNAVTLDLREFAIEDALQLQTFLWAAALAKVKINVQELPSSFFPDVDESKIIVPERLQNG